MGHGVACELDMWWVTHCDNRLVDDDKGLYVNVDHGDGSEEGKDCSLTCSQTDYIGYYSIHFDAFCAFVRKVLLWVTFTSRGKRVMRRIEDVEEVVSRRHSVNGFPEAEGAKEGFRWR